MEKVVWMSIEVIAKVFQVYNILLKMSSKQPGG